MTIEQIKDKLNNFINMHLLERDILCANLCKLVRSNKNTKTFTIISEVIE